MEDETERPLEKVRLTPALQQAERGGTTECREKALRLEKGDETERPCQNTGGGNQGWGASPHLRREQVQEGKGGKGYERHRLQQRRLGVRTPTVCCTLKCRAYPKPRACHTTSNRGPGGSYFYPYDERNLPDQNRLYPQGASA